LAEWAIRASTVSTWLVTDGRCSRSASTQQKDAPGCFKVVRRAGRHYIKQRRRKITVELTPAEIDLLVKYARRG
jgi:hypothetical protein